MVAVLSTMTLAESLPCPESLSPALAPVFQLEVLIRKAFSIDALTSSAISPSEVSTLDHEVLDYTMEFAVFVAKSFLEKGEEVA